MACELSLAMPPIPPVAELIQIALDMDFAEVVKGAFEKRFSMRYCQAHASHLLILKASRNMPHLNAVSKLHDDMMASPPVCTNMPVRSEQ